MTKEALTKLNEKQMDNTKFRGKLRGYLDCLRDVDVLTEYEMRGLYLYFIEADGSSERA